MGIKDMTLEEKIGQMLMVGFPSPTYDDHVEKLVSEYKIGNIILFSRNVKGKEQLQNLCNNIQMNIIKHTGIPALVAIDQEGGMVTRIYKDATYLPGNMAIAATNEVENAYKIGEIAGKELRALGININFAPVLDINNNLSNPVIGVRSYGENPEKVAEFGINYIKGLQKENVIATAKHFPGHGDTSVDSHLDLPLVSYNKERLYRIELYPFKKAIENGVEAIMTAHILFSALEENKLPATLSHNILTNILRKELRFNGLIITDCMEMNAIAKYFGTAKAAAMAIKAGADIVLVSHTKKLQIEAFNEIKEAVLRGEISIERIDESVERIIQLKEKYKLFENPYPDENKIKTIVGCKEHQEIAKNISLNSITIVKDENNLLPIRKQKILAVSPETVPISGVDDTLMDKVSFAKAFVQKFGGVEKTIPVNPDEDLINTIREEAKDKEIVVVGAYNASLNEGQVRLVNSLLEVNKNIIVVALRNPYDLLEFEDVPTYVCTYEYTPLSVESVLEVLSGNYVPKGELPVSL
ncbi:MAG: beta-N-acetylhexosaminidase [Thermoanaerobacterium sp.]|jgi:beta-N-acetylhexosaminidase|uniref:beta-N-acetylhexosaminidase n=1 Tax=Thermoanaerobacter sp. (strain X514) TaxID=399726 RepID=UPI0001A96A3C|nr:beta-N-acetylhexosaminidase [Thermoanaerobacter sp. X514]MDI3477130.1 beta-N-acetylhexosaminidase [Thermoanaerobacterium sp.]